MESTVICLYTKAKSRWKSVQIYLLLKIFTIFLVKHEEEGTKKQRKEKENVIEKAKKYNPEVYIPSHWVNVIKTAKKRSPKFQITEMTSDDFFSTTQLDKDIVNRKILVDGGKVEWLKTSWIRIEKGQPRFLKMKQSHDDDDVPFSTLTLNRRVWGKRTYSKLSIIRGNWG